MIACSGCLKFSAFLDENRLCAYCQKKLLSKPIDLNVQFYGLTKAIPYKRDKKILSRGDWMELRQKLDKYYMAVSDDEIEDYNINIDLYSKRKTSRLLMGDEGHIYLISSSVGYHKIGRAVNLEARHAEHSRMYPVQLNLVHSILVNQVTHCETYLLRRFKDKKMQGEWFLLDEEDVAWIKKLDTASLEALVAEALGI